jgi:hypothetical protein
MTVMSGNPCRSNPGYQANPYVLIDSATNKIIRTWRGSMTDRKPWDWAADAARRLGRPVFVVAHPYVPQTFRAGVEVSPLFYFGGPFQEVHPDGSTSAGPPGGYKRNPRGFFPSLAGGVAGTLIANALSNPAADASWDRMTGRQRREILEIVGLSEDEAYTYRECPWGNLPTSVRRMVSRSWEKNPPSGPSDEHAARELVLYIENDSGLYHHAFVPIVKNLMKKRAKGTYKSELAIIAFMNLATEGARKYVKEFGTAYQKIDTMFNRNTRLEVARQLRDSFETEAGLGNYDKMTWGVSNNPASKRAQRFMSGEVSHLMRKRGYPQRRAVAAAYSIARKKGYKLNPGRRRKVTMSLEKFAKYIKSKNDPRLWNDFLRKIRGYQKWTHGTLPKNVTIEMIDKPGVSGLWMTYDAGTVPESAYVMPAGSKRKGAWKHPWESQPKIKHDPDAGIIMHKLSGGAKVTDFYHH